MEITCLICNEKIYHSVIGNHLKKKHQISQKDYYVKYVDSNCLRNCKYCGKDTKFRSITFGFYNFCSKKCRNTHGANELHRLYGKDVVRKAVKTRQRNNPNHSRENAIKMNKKLNSLCRKIGFRSDDELKFYNIIKDLGVRYCYEPRLYINEFYNEKYNLDQKWFKPDFIINGVLIVEIDGAFHNREKVKKLDGIKDSFFKDIGYKVLRIKSSDLNNSTNELKDKIFLALR